MPTRSNLLKGSYALFNNKYFTSIVFIVCLLTRLIMQLYFFGMKYDRSFQLLAARNFHSGHGITVNELAASSPFQQIYLPIPGWPPGYSIIIGLLTFVTNNNVITAGIVFDLICVFLFFLFSRKILKLINTPLWLINLFTLVSGFFAYDFCQDATTDLNALAFFLCGLYMCLNYLGNSSRSINYIILLSVINFICPFLRFMYIPISFIIPVYLLVSGFKLNDIRLRKAGTVSLVLTTFLISGLLLFQSRYTGSAAYISTSEKGFYFQNLRKLYPIIISAFINIRFYLNNPTVYSIINTVFLYLIFAILNIAGIILSIYFFIKFFIARRWNDFTLRDHYFLIGGITSFCILLLLSWLSLRYALPGNFLQGWTYVQEPRYFAFIVLFVQQAFFILTYHYRNQINYFGRLMIYGIAILLFTEVLHGIYFTNKIIRKDLSSNELPNPGLVQAHYIKTLIKNSKSKKSRIIFISQDATVNNIANLENVDVLYNLSDRNKFIGHCADCTIFVAIDIEKNDPEQKAFMREAEKQKISSVENFIYYEITYP